MAPVVLPLAFSPPLHIRRASDGGRSARARASRARLCCRAQTPPPEGQSPQPPPPAAQSSAEQTTRKWGLEAGLWNLFTSKDAAGGETSGREKMTQAKDLLARYGSAYLVTSISLSLVSFSLSYALVASGVDVAALLARLGLGVSETSEQAGLLALAYAVHKATSPIRFPPTVALTPVVARWMGRKDVQ